MTLVARCELATAATATAVCYYWLATQLATSSSSFYMSMAAVTHFGTALQQR